MEQLGIDIGGSGMKAAIVETKSGVLLTERFRLPTPDPSLPNSLADTVKTIVDHFQWKEAVGCSFPAIIKKGVCFSAGNIREEWIGTDVNDLFSKRCGQPFYTANDADMASVAEMNLGNGKGLPGKVILITVGTGLGSGFFYNGELIANTEFGHMYHTNGKVIEKYASDSARKRKDLSLKKWAKRFDFFLNYLTRTVSPDYFIIGGGISKKFDKFKKHLTIDVPLMQAKFENNAGIIGAAIFAEQMSGKNT
jgi:polyphosphate glucokinase